MNGTRDLGILQSEIWEILLSGTDISPVTKCTKKIKLSSS